MASSPQSILISRQVEAEVTCVVCSEKYCFERREPVALPSCGHTFCRRCLQHLAAVRSLYCPTCRTPHDGPRVDQLPTVFALLSLAEHLTKTEGSGCGSHGMVVEWWCGTCDQPLCGHCLLDGHVKDGHTITTAHEFAKHKRAELMDEWIDLSLDIMNKKTKCVSSVASLVEKIVERVEEGAALQNSMKSTDKILEHISKASSLATVIEASSMMNGVKKDVQMILKGEVESPRRRVRRYSSCLGTDRDVPTSGSPQIPLGQDTSFEEITSPTTPSYDSSDIFSYNDTPSPSPTWSNTPPTPDPTPPATPMQSPAQPTFQTPVQTPDSLEYTTSPSAHPTSPSAHPRLSWLSATKLKINSPANCKLQVRGVEPIQCPLSVCHKEAGQGGRMGRIRMEDGRIHVYALEDDSIDASITVQLQLLLERVPPQRPEVFLVLAHGDHTLGKVTIRLHGHMRRAQHFLALCLATLGPSYRHSIFQGVNNYNQPGETLAGGLYKVEFGEASMEGLVEGLEWGGEHVRERRAGQVVAAMANAPDRDAFFHICTKSDPGRKFACVFGEVVEGMNVVHAGVRRLGLKWPTERDLVVRDCGLVLPKDVSIV